jgi:hypothetical protein
MVIDEFVTSALSVPEISLGLLIHAAVAERVRRSLEGFAR